MKFVHQELSEISVHFRCACEEWTSTQIWRDLSWLDSVEEAKLRPATQEVNELHERQTSRFRDESARMGSLRRIRQDAESFYSLIEEQVVFA